MDSGNIQILSVSGDKIPGLDINAVSLNVRTSPYMGLPYVTVSLCHSTCEQWCNLSDVRFVYSCLFTALKSDVSLCIDEEGEHIASCAQDGKVSGAQLISSSF